jgi:hypothetical protein
LGQLVLDAEFAVLLQLQNRGGRELLGDGPDAEFRLRRDPHPVPDVRIPVSILVQNSAVLGDQERRPRIALLDHVLEQPIDQSLFRGHKDLGIGAHAQQELDGIVPAGNLRRMQRRQTRAHLSVDVNALLQEHLHGVKLAALNGGDQLLDQRRLSHGPARESPSARAILDLQNQVIAALRNVTGTRSLSGVQPRLDPLLMDEPAIEPHLHGSPLPIPRIARLSRPCRARPRVRGHIGSFAEGPARSTYLLGRKAVHHTGSP